MSYLDKTLEGVPTVTETRDRVTLSGWTDRVYLSTPDTLTIDNVTSSGGSLVFNKTHLPDTVVWNPWEAMAGGMSDLGAENYQSFICVEAGQCVKPIKLAPGQKWTSGHKLTYKE